MSLDVATALEELAVKLVTDIVEAVGIDVFNAILQKHPLTAGQIIASERAASDAVLDEAERVKLAGALAEGKT